MSPPHRETAPAATSAPSAAPSQDIFTFAGDAAAPELTRRIAGILLAAPCVGAATVVVVLSADIHRLLPFLGASILLTTLGFILWETDVARLFVARERIDGVRFVRREISVRARRNAPDDADRLRTASQGSSGAPPAEDLVVDGAVVGHARGAVVGLRRDFVKDVPSRHDQSVWWNRVWVRVDTTIYMVLNTLDLQKARDLAKRLAVATHGPDFVVREKEGRADWPAEASAALPSLVLTIAAPLAWRLSSSAMPLSLRVSTLVLVLGARASVGALRLSRCAGVDAQAFSRFFKGAQPVRPTPGLSPSVGSRIYWTAQAAVVAAITVGCAIR